MTEKIRIGISACLLGEQVRYDGGHKRDRLVTEVLGRFFEYVPVCPEVEMGLPTPREALRLMGDEATPRLVFARSGGDITKRMDGWAQKRVKELEAEELCGFIFKSRSPSSGMERVKLYDANGVPRKTGVGLFARRFMEHFPLVPVEEDGRLHDPKLRENFIECVFTFRRWRKMLEEKRSRGGLVEFHSRHKLLLLAHNPEGYRRMGKLVAAAGEGDLEECLEAYQGELMRTMRLQTTAAKQINVLQHLIGYFKKSLSADEKAEVQEILEDYRKGHFPLIVPITLINHFVRKYDQTYLKQQYYLCPHPLELQLRNHV